MLEQLKIDVCNANLDLVAKGLVIYTWGNVSGLDRETRNIVIKPSGVSYDLLKPEDMCVVNLDTGELVEGKLKPSSDTPTHIEIYRAFPEIGGVTHTHSINAVAYAQAGCDLAPLGTTHADYFYGSVPCTRALTSEEIFTDYEKNTGKVIAETINNRNLNPLDMPAILVKQHGPFTWGRSASESVYHSVVLETIAEMNLRTSILNPQQTRMDENLLKKHYLRKHGPNAYYGQK